MVKECCVEALRRQGRSVSIEVSGLSASRREGKSRSYKVDLGLGFGYELGQIKGYRVNGSYIYLRLRTNGAIGLGLMVILKDGGEVKEFQRSFRHSDTERLSRSDEVLKLKNFKKDATLKLSKSTNQEWYEHVGPEVTRSQDDKVTRWRNEIMLG
ncbi:hypothetical protein Tco_0749947 [Tanacetum coccineum]|uniref:Uncharacterized protein n=1 Tax=Tanacetum coccineum TaxID=301880 RepID=A0ABQ4Z0X8_9ASTR